MFFENKLKTKKTLKKQIVYNNFESEVVTDKIGEIQPQNQTIICYNFLNNSGSLKNGYGFANMALPVSEVSSTTRNIIVGTKEKNNLWEFRLFNTSTQKQENKLFWSDEDNNLNYITIFGYDIVQATITTGFSSVPSGISYTVNGIDYMLFSDESGMYKFTLGTGQSKNSVLPKFIDICTGYDVLFGINGGKKNKVYYSTKPDPTEWLSTESYIELNDERGACNKLIFFDDYLYVFRDYGITKISQYGTASDYSVYNLFLSASKIYGNTVVQCGDKILFFAKDGFYSFNGTTVKKIELNIQTLFENIKNENAVACLDGENYILALKLNFGDNTSVGCEGYESGYVNNAVIIFNINTNKFNIMRGVDVKDLICIKTGNFQNVFATFNGEHSAKIGMLNLSGQIFGTNLLKVWQSAKTDFGSPEKNKIFKEIYVTANQTCELTLITDLETKTIAVSGANEIQKIRIFVKGKTLALKISSSSSVEIKPVKIIYEEIEE